MKNNKIYTFEEIKRIVNPILQKYRAEKGILFGSYARKDADENSDIDIMVIGGDCFDPTDIFCIADEIFTQSGKSIDVYERREISTDSDFYRNIFAEGIEL